MLNKKILRKFGFKNDQEGIINRYLREEEGWNEHLENTKNFILQVADKMLKQKVVVLGSGWLLDVPLESLSATFENVVLIDVVHPRQIEHKITKMPGVNTISTDITGLVIPVYEALKEKKKEINLLELKQDYDNYLLTELESADFVVSVNLLNQLDILICDYIKKTNRFSEDEISKFRKQIQSNHLNLLPAGKSALITDYEELNFNDKEEIIQNKKLVHINLPHQNRAKKWKWKFDLKKTYHTNLTTVFKVMAIEI